MICLMEVTCLHPSPDQNNYPHSSLLPVALLPIRKPVLSHGFSLWVLQILYSKSLKLNPVTGLQQPLGKVLHGRMTPKVHLYSNLSLES